ncbi:MAG: RnfABCDGE type electron transport complex subunit D [Hyphomicrobiales bacterium]|nr:RnfABCDGE type electron transport complex subunit D [Hyphomicrobiales bacterium]
MATATPVDLRLPALRRFALAITVVNLLGHLWFGFEQSWAQMFTALFTAYGMEIILELIDAWAAKRPTRFGPRVRDWIDFMLPAHITGLAIGMLLDAGDRLLPFMFAGAFGIGSKAIFTAPVGRSRRHFMNPSNAGLALSFMLFTESVQVAPPYMFTENLGDIGDWVLPAIIVCTGTMLNAKFTQRLPLALGWLGSWALLAVARSLVFDVPFTNQITAMTGTAFVLFTFYMVTDPGTTPSVPWRQVCFGACVALGHFFFVAIHISFGMFFSLFVVCLIRGTALNLMALLAPLKMRIPSPAPIEIPSSLAEESVSRRKVA